MFLLRRNLLLILALLLRCLLLLVLLHCSCLQFMFLLRRNLLLILALLLRCLLLLLLLHLLLHGLTPIAGLAGLRGQHRLRVVDELLLPLPPCFDHSRRNDPVSPVVPGVAERRPPL